MAEQMTEQGVRRGVSVFLKKHEQWSAWGFYTVMAALVMCGSGQQGFALLSAPVVGILQLYLLKIGALYVRRGTAWAVTGLCFALVPFYAGSAVAAGLCLQVVVLCHVLVWARGKRREFCARHFYVLGLAVVASVLTLWGAALYYVPLGGLMLWVNRARLGMAVGMLVLGAATAVALLHGLAGVEQPQAVSLWWWLLFPLHVPVYMLVRRSRPERRRVLAVGMAGSAGLCCAVGVFGCSPAVLGLLPMVWSAVVGGVLFLRARCEHCAALVHLRIPGLICPFVTLLAVLIVPVYRAATAAPHEKGAAPQATELPRK